LFGIEDASPDIAADFIIRYAIVDRHLDDIDERRIKMMRKSCVLRVQMPSSLLIYELRKQLKLKIKR